ncbi:putative hydrolase [Lojkania enalia]|uniref:Hydrolase n=1 Tax=Lojkania enalia TaxID=147567 RepID=A0A9P4KDE8_9PLEO|nr:putative hydrolase [Didymosphaeria enalia]
MRQFSGIVSSLLVTASVLTSTNADYVLKEGPLDTPWTKTVGLNPWPQYPRPQLERSAWKNLNGIWKYQNATSPDDVHKLPFANSLTSEVLVPFCLESALSGIMNEYSTYSWYGTSFDVPSSWHAGDRVLLNFGAVDYQATVFVNGHNVGNHTGGYWSFTFDVTDFLKANGTNELLVFVYDPTDRVIDGKETQIVLGKQSLHFNHIFYTPCSGIWQTVWLESAPAEHITELHLDANMDGRVNVTVYSSYGWDSPVEITIYEPHSDTIKAVGKGTAGTAFQFTVDSPDLWSPDSPTLYNLTATLGSDIVNSYTGFRTVSRGVINGIQRPLINGKFFFWFGTLDQGFWPDGIYTAPTYEAMVSDLQALKEVGYNMVRKHIKVEPALFYKAADELGLLLIQDMPSLRTYVYTNPEPKSCPPRTAVGSPEAQQEFDSQLALLIQQQRNYPSIVTWVIYNEGWGQDSGNPPDGRLTDMVRSLDPTRLVNSVTGWWDHGFGDFHDNHRYPQPQCGTPWYSLENTPYDSSRIGIQGEFGGIGHNVSADHLWKEKEPIDHIANIYSITTDLKAWNHNAHILLGELRQQIEHYACSGAVWTETTDVEGEVNGMLTYDRRINRMDKDQWKRDIQALYDTAERRTMNATARIMSREEAMDDMGLA